MFKLLRRSVALLLMAVLLVPMIAACGSTGTGESNTNSASANTNAASTNTNTATTNSNSAATNSNATMNANMNSNENMNVNMNSNANSSANANSNASSGSTAAFTPRDVTAQLTGSGASFPDPVYQRWIQDYQSVAPNVTINYQSVGSGQGRKDFFGNVTDFGASDKFASDKELSDYGQPVLHIPVVLGAVVATYNLEGVNDLQFSPETLVGIFMGTITNWNDPKIAADNPNAKLPDQPITVVHRSDGSGTTSIWTNYLSSVSSEWKDKVGAGDTVQWPVGQGGEKNPGVAALVKQTPGAIGYVELTYALGNNLPASAVKNAAGQFVKPSVESVSAAAEGFMAQIPDDLRVNIVNPPEGENAYPISGFTWLLVRKEMQDENKAKALTDFIYWALTQGSDTATQLFYAPLPEQVRTKAIDKLTQVTVNGQPVFQQP